METSKDPTGIEISLVLPTNSIEVQFYYPPNVPFFNEFGEQ